MVFQEQSIVVGYQAVEQDMVSENPPGLCVICGFEVL